MDKPNMWPAIIFVLLAGLLFLTRCGNSDPKPIKTAMDSAHVTGPAPDNNSATNPSLADTNYEKDRTRPITDTMKKK
jgi:hypothetical protein